MTPPTHRGTGLTRPPHGVHPRHGGASRRWRIAVVEDHRLQRLRTEEVIDAQRAFRVVRSVETLPELVTWLGPCRPEERPHVVLLDLVVERGPNAEPAAVRSLLRSGIKVIVLSALSSPPLVREMLRAGVDGVISKRDTEEDIVAAVWSVLGGRRWMTTELAAVVAGDEVRPKLSEQEERALVLYASGLTLDAVATALAVKRDTAKTYLDRVKAKYAAVGRPVRSKVEMTRVAVVDGYLELADRSPAVPG